MKFIAVRFFSPICFLFILTIAGLSQSSNPNPQDETQFWNETQMIVPLNKKTDLILIGVFRGGGNFTDFLRPVDERGGGAVAFKVHKNLTIAPTYLYVSQQPTNTRRNAEHRLILNISPKFRIGKFMFTDRNHFERRVRHSLPDFLMYRNRLQIDHPVKIRDFEFKVFVADEVWYSTPANAWIRNRISGGIIKQFTPHFGAEFFYLRQNDGRARPGDLHVIGTLFRITL
ncbi:MAG TPA: DUF2490 domain-containing protein [Blastocatellia bacterium]|nr:DUF2490 domain-containing protein [Blastocatellia bacterium]HMX29670.1 DUF2490 domain-containing protein [Blastocatellia bacterium]HMY73129.1 DUF2490 domain-containing protein [Blastocatellia bacterium]HMZ18362.1 DUF2490 domain-containing protein [Blastocatellia bacterium]HNG31711.1 DUF2490 domain-containing protein [Blastocatellia bacterium]